MVLVIFLTNYLQELLKHYGRTEPGSEKSADSETQDNLLFKKLDKDVQALVQPYLDSKYVVASKEKDPPGLVFKKSGDSFRGWLRNWLRQLVDNHAHGVELRFPFCQSLLSMTNILI